MREIILYLIQVVAASGIFYGYYHFVLRNKRFHKYNRFYLIASCILSLVVPFLNIPLYFSDTQQQSSTLLQTLTVISGSDYEQEVIVRASTHPSINFFTFTNILYFLYLLVAVIALLRIFFSINKIKKIAKNNPSEKIQNIRFINTDEPGTPFSFFRWLFWNRKIELHSAKGEQVFRHELFHIRQVHSLDIFFMELLTVAFWINPFFHLIKKEVKAIHEFLADQFAIHEDTKWEYAEMLLQQALDTKLNLVNPFFHNQIKRRIAMITTSKKPGHQYFRKLMALPVTAVAVGLFAFTYKSVKIEPDSYRDELSSVVTNNNLDGIDNNAIISNENEIKLATPPSNEVNTENSKTDTLPKKSMNETENKIFDKVEIDASFPGGNVNWTKYLERSLNAEVPINNKAPKGVYTTVTMFLVDTDGIISDIKPLTTHGFGMEKEAMRVISKGPKWLPAMVNGKPVKSYKKQPITFRVSGVGNNNNNPVAITKDMLNEVVVVYLQKETDNKIFDKIEEPAQFPGGVESWRKYLSTEINYKTPVDSGATSGTYKVEIQFIVNIDGSISDIKPLTTYGYGMEQEAIRVISKGPKWIPAKQNGNFVKSYVKIPVTFVLTKEPETHQTNN